MNIELKVGLTVVYRFTEADLEELGKFERVGEELTKAIIATGGDITNIKLSVEA